MTSRKRRRRRAAARSCSSFGQGRCSVQCSRARRDALATAVGLLKVPTFNPPGDNYLEICDLILDPRLRPAISTVSSCAPRSPATVMAPRWNIIARRWVLAPAPAFISMAMLDIVALGEGWTKDPFGADIEADRIWARVLRHEGGLAARDHRRRGLLEICPDFVGAIEFQVQQMKRQAGLAASPGSPKGISAPTSGPCDHPRTAEQGQDLPWASWRMVGQRSKQGHIAHGSMPFWAIVCASYGGGACRNGGALLVSCPWHAANNHAGGAAAGPSVIEYQRHSWRA